MPAATTYCCSWVVSAPLLPSPLRGSWRRAVASGTTRTEHGVLEGRTTAMDQPRTHRARRRIPVRRGVCALLVAVVDDVRRAGAPEGDRDQECANAPADGDASPSAVRPGLVHSGGPSF